MPKDKLRATKTMSHPEGTNLLRAGEVFMVSDWIAKQLVSKGLAEHASEEDDNKTFSGYEKAVKPPTESTEGSSTREGRQAPPRPSEGATGLLKQNGAWYYFSDGEKRQGKEDAAEYLGITVEELDEFADNL